MIERDDEPERLPPTDEQLAAMLDEDKDDED
jgi:hypothetical protein